MKSFLSVLLVFLLAACSAPEKGKTIHIIHAGSLSYPVKELTEAFLEENPDIQIFTEAWGSKAGARRVMELETPADIFLSADYMVIENMLIPHHASWYLPFASNEMAIVYTDNSRYAADINQDNWYEILLRPDVSIGRSDPDHDPCGVRAVFTCRLAELFYQEEGLANKLLNKDLRNIRPKETDLIALLENNHIDYIFLYRSVAQQHNLPYLPLPVELNLGEANLADWYSQVSIQTLGSSPGETITETGQPMIYGATIPNKTTHAQIAGLFVAFLMSEKGREIMLSSGQPPVTAVPNPYFDNLPENLKDFSARLAE